jgi:hypothetical protein
MEESNPIEPSPPSSLGLESEGDSSNSSIIPESEEKKGQSSKITRIWSYFHPRFSRFWTDLKNGFYYLFLRDFNITRQEYGAYLLQGLMAGTLLTFWIGSLFGSLPNVDFPLIAQIIVLIISVLTLLIGGSIVDLFLRVKHLLEILTFISIGPILLLIFVNNIIVSTIASILLGMITLICTITFFTNILSRTSLLNRARVFTFVFFLFGLFLVPIAIVITSTVVTQYTWVVLLGLVFIGYLFVKRMPQDPFVGATKSFEHVFSIFKVEGIGSTFLILLLTAFTLGFYTSDVFTGSIATIDFVIIAVVGLISIPAIAAILDNVGRKPLAYLTLGALGFLSIFFDFPEIDFFQFTAVRVGVYVFSILFLLIYSGTIAGDLASRDTRGRIMSIMLLGVIGGAILGVISQLVILGDKEVFDQSTTIIISDILTFLIFITVILFSGVKETFESDTPDWRKFLDRFYIITKSGIGLYNIDFTQPENNLKSDDLVSGGLSGIQQMLKEISHSNQEIQVLDHGDTTFLFNNGIYSNAILIVKKDLRVYREKLRDFHEHFELLNRTTLQRFYGDMKRIIGLGVLQKRYFS